MSNNNVQKNMYDTFYLIFINLSQNNLNYWQISIINTRISQRINIFLNKFINIIHLLSKILGSNIRLKY